MGMMRDLQRTEVAHKPSPKKKEGKKKKTREIKISYKGYCVYPKMARHLAKGKQKITSGKVLKRYKQYVLGWINCRSRRLQPLTQL